MVLTGSLLHETMARTTRNSNKNRPKVTEKVDEDMEHEGSKSKSQKKFQGEEGGESSDSDDFIIVENENRVKDSPRAETEPFVQQETKKKSDKEKKIPESKGGKDKGTSINTDANICTPFSAVWLLVFIVGVPIFVSFFFESTTTEVYKNLQPELTKLFQNFKNQPEKSDRKLRKRALSYLADKTSPQPFVIMIAATRKDQFVADCFANRVGKLLDSEPLVINGSLYTGVQSDKAKLEIDEKLQDTFQENIFPTVAIIHNLEVLSFDTSMLFYKYCDHDHPRYRKAAIIFTVTLPDDYHSISTTDDEVEKEGIVESYLTDESIWIKDKDFDINKLGALLSRISDTVIVLRSESHESLETFCKK